MYWTLPWELRHRIQTFCVEGVHDSDVIVRRKGESDLKLLVRHPTGPHSYEWAKDQTLIQLGPDHVGSDIYREMAKMYCGTRNFRIIHTELDCVRTLIGTACFGSNFCPAAHLRRLHLQFQPFSHARLLDRRLKDREEAKACQALESLALLNPLKVSVEIRLHISQGAADNEERGELLSVAEAFVVQIMAYVSRLAATGMKIDLIVEEGWNDADGTKLCSDSAYLKLNYISQLLVR